MSKIKKLRNTPKRQYTVEISDDEQEVSTDLSAFTISIHGDKGIGKTSLAAQAENSIVAMTEPKRRNLRIRKPIELYGKPNWTVWERCLDMVDKLTTKRSKYNVDTLVIDTVDRLYTSCFDYVCRTHKVKHPNERNKDFGQCWRDIRFSFEDTMNQLLYSDISLIFLSHAKKRTRDFTDDSDAVEIVEPSCDPKAFEYLKAVCDFSFYYGYSGVQRMMTVRGNELVYSSCGVADAFLNTKGEPLAQIPMGNNPIEAWENLNKAFNNEPVRGSRTVEQLARAMKGEPEEPTKKKKRKSFI